MRWHPGTVTHWAQSASGIPRQRLTRSLPWMPGSASVVRLLLASCRSVSIMLHLLAGL